MAFKPVRAADETSYVSSLDPAIDWDRMVDEILEDPEYSMITDKPDKRDLALEILSTKIAAAAGSHPPDAEKLMKFKDGESPCRFVIGAIDPVDMNRIQDECNVSSSGSGKFAELRWRSFLSCVRKIENWPTEVKTDAVGGVEKLDPTWVKHTFYRGLRNVALEVGLAAWKWNLLTEEEIRL